MGDKKRVLSGIQPTNEMHIGNYFGAIKNWLKLQENYECFYCVVDYHAMTIPYKPDTLRANTKDMYASLLACGIDPQKAVLFVQSMVPEHVELNWILNCVTSYGELGRMTQFKDKSELVKTKSKDHFVSSGLFFYPVLQAADILIYHADYVPVGKDQEQHLELTRNIVTRFNNQFGHYFNLPEPLFSDIPKLLSPADPTKKMSKSLGPKHYIGLFEEEATIRKKVGSAVTDTGGSTGNELSPGTKNLFEILRACGKNDEYTQLMNAYNQGQLMYKDLKAMVADALVELTLPLAVRKKEILSDKDYLKRTMKEGSERAREYARNTLKEVRNKAGLPTLK